MFDAILFDNDGTIVDSRDLILESFRFAMQEVIGFVPSDDELLRGVGLPLADQMRDFTDDPTAADRMLAFYRRQNQEYHDSRIKAFPGIVDALAQLHRAGIALGVVTSKMHDLAWRGLEIVGAAPYLDCIVCPDTFPEHKPAPGPIIEGIRMLGEQRGISYDPERCAYVGDSIFDVQAGNAAGCVTIAVTWGMGSREVLEAEHPTYLVDTIDELLGLCLAKR